MLQESGSARPFVSMRYASGRKVDMRLKPGERRRFDDVQTGKPEGSAIPQLLKPGIAVGSLAYLSSQCRT
jgi:hypothetical protein